MTTFQARSWAHAVRRATKSRDQSRLWAATRTAMGITILVALLAAAVAIRVLVYVRF